MYTNTVYWVKWTEENKTLIGIFFYVKRFSPRNLMVVSFDNMGKLCIFSNLFNLFFVLIMCQIEFHPIFVCFSICLSLPVDFPNFEIVSFFFLFLLMVYKISYIYIFIWLHNTVWLFFLINQSMKDILYYFLN